MSPFELLNFGTGRKRKGNDASGSGSGVDNNDENSETAEVDGDNFTIARSKGSRRRFGKEKKPPQDGDAPEASHIGRMRGFPAEDGEARNGAPQAERQLFEQW